MGWYPVLEPRCTPHTESPATLLDVARLQAIETLPRATLLPGVTYFHGRNGFDRWITSNHQFCGDYKWLSADPMRAVHYCYFTGTAGAAAPELWLCEVTAPLSMLCGSQWQLAQLPALQGSQSAFPMEFPRTFGEYAAEIFKAPGPYAFLNVDGDLAASEYLVSDPGNALHVTARLAMPADRGTARERLQELLATP